MNVSISDIKDTPGLSKKLSYSESKLFDGITADGPVDVDLEIMSGGDGTVSVRGLIRSKVTLVCSRCAGDYSELLEVSINERFVPEASLCEDSEEEVRVDELCVFGYVNDELNIDDLIRDNLIASLPYRPLCKQDCRGVCPECGQNLNEKDCGCGTAEENNDPRWEALKKFSVDSPQAGKS